MDPCVQPSLIERIRACRLCQGSIPWEVRPVIQFSPLSQIVIVGQAPGRKVHESGVPWNDASGRTLRKWLDVDEHTFYDPELFSIVPMGFCYPGKGVSGDLPPRRECAPLWHAELGAEFRSDPLFLLVGQYAQRYYLEAYKGNITDTIKSYREYLPRFFPLPHPSPRNQNWLKVNSWFEQEVLPPLKEIVFQRLNPRYRS